MSETTSGVICITLDTMRCTFVGRKPKTTIEMLTPFKVKFVLCKFKNIRFINS